MLGVLKNLAFWVVLAIVLGIFVGYTFPQIGIDSKFGIDYFIMILKWMVGPIIFLTIISGIVGLDSLKDLGSIGLKGFIYFEVVSTIALAMGIFGSLLLAPGAGMHLDANSFDTSSVEKFSGASKDVGSIWSILANAVPKAPLLPYDDLNTLSGFGFMIGMLKNTLLALSIVITPFIKANTLQVLFMALFLAIVLSFSPKKIKDFFINPIEKAQNWVLKALSIFMWLSPLAAYCAMAYLIGKFGIESLIGMLSLLGTMLVSCLVFIFVVLGVICYAVKVNIFKFMRFIAKEVLVVFATSSSEVALAPLMKKLESAGIHKGCVGVITPFGYSFNLDCTNIYLSACVIFLAQAFDIELSFSHLLSILLILMVTSKGAVGVTGSGFVVLAGTLGSMHDVIPVVAVTVLLGVDKFMSEMRAVGNLCGNAVACLIVGIWDKKIDRQKFNYAINHPDEFDFEKLKAKA
ncbi:C4-dicarboxylate transport protein [Campylobacter vicugnae]|uniref:cation:dicarboxylate symporter family transporter n=1 Tax=Campylobacter vicugnae TaxID=1660076 RepID=UPI000A30076F|nr:cation:dicarboxylase symporter family transporter [Campylobacter sp. RM12175]ARR03291.1 C4-dicarboxylate transport protein [Campylobacter sp. RM12175]